MLLSVTYRYGADEEAPASPSRRLVRVDECELDEPLEEAAARIVAAADGCLHLAGLVDAETIEELTAEEARA